MLQAVTAREGMVASLHADRPWRAFRGGKWMAVAGPRCAGDDTRHGWTALAVPSRSCYTLAPPSRGAWALGVIRPPQARRA